MHVRLRLLVVEVVVNITAVFFVFDMGFNYLHQGGNVFADFFLSVCVCTR